MTTPATSSTRLAVEDEPQRCFEIDISCYRSLWMIRIPEIDVVIKVSRGEDVEMTAREHIAVSVDVSIAEVAVQVMGES